MRHLIAIIILLLLIAPALAESDEAREIMVRDLRALYSDKGIYAGAHQFKDYWARDSLFAMFGANRLQDFNISRKQLELFIKYQKPNGQIPLRVAESPFLLKAIGLNFKLTEYPRYREDKFFNTPLDQNCLFLISAWDYIQQSNDISFAREHFRSFKKAAEWLTHQDKNKDFLLEERSYCGWADSLKKQGTVLYTNVCYYKALKSLSEISAVIGKTQESTAYLIWSDLIRSRINNEFWLKDGYYLDWINAGLKYTYFSTDGNVLAILWGVANDTQAKQIQNKMKEFKMNTDFAVKTNYPKYAVWRVSLINHIMGIPDYHNGVYWLWLSCLDALAKEKTGFHTEAQQEIDQVEDKIIEYNHVYEVYEPSGRPLDRLYKAEVPFAWSAGVCLYALDELERLQNA